MNYLVEFDRYLFQLINEANNPLLDELMWLISTRWFFIPLYVVLLGVIFLRLGKDTWRVLIAVALMILLSDQLSVSVKFLVERLRPCHDSDLASIVHLVNNKCGGKFGFYSSHASNTAALAVFCGLLLQSDRWLIGLLLWSFIVGYSRIYLGNHFPGDVLTGWFAGGLIGWLTASLFTMYNSRYQK